MAKKVPDKKHSDGDFFEENDQQFVEEEEERAEMVTIVKVKVSDDGGESWQMGWLDITRGPGETGLRPGQIIILDLEWYLVTADEFGEIGLKRVQKRRRR